MAGLPPRRPGAGLHPPLTEINVTPLVDVMLVLLIVFMVTAPMLAAGLPVSLPQARATTPLDPREPVVLTLTKDRRLLLGADEVDRAGIAEAARARLAGRDVPIHLRGDREVPYGEVVAVMDELARAGLTRLALVADARAGAASPAGVPGGATDPSVQAAPTGSPPR